jgi:N-acetylneuraminic acid mutarotase
MKPVINKSSLYILILLIYFAVSGLWAQTWTQEAPIPTPRWYPACAVLNGKIYVIGGQDSTYPYVSMNTVEAYDPATDTWNTLAPMPTDRWGLMTSVVDGKIYAIGGRKGSASQGHSPSAVVEEYDPINDTWITKSPMPTARGYGGSIVYEDTTFVFGGRSGIIVNVVEKYHPATDTWSSEPPMPAGSYMFGTVLINTTAYIVGGLNSASVNAYDMDARTWQAKSPMPTARGAVGISVCDDMIYVAGGRGGSGDEFEQYDPVTDTWDILSPMPTPREGIVGAIVNENFFAIAGSKPLDQGGLPYYDLNERASQFSSTKESVNNKNVFRQSLYCRPNPFNRLTEIVLTIPEAAGDSDITCVIIKIYDSSGRLVKSFTRAPEVSVSVLWDGTDDSRHQLPQGVYCCRARFGSMVATTFAILAPGWTAVEY